MAFRPATKPGCVRASDESLEIDVPAAFADELVHALKPQRGDYELPCYPGLRIRVVPSEIKGPDGQVVQVIG